MSYPISDLVVIFFNTMAIYYLSREDGVDHQTNSRIDNPYTSELHSIFQIYFYIHYYQDISVNQHLPTTEDPTSSADEENLFDFQAEEMSIQNQKKAIEMARLEVLEKEKNLVAFRKSRKQRSKNRKTETVEAGTSKTWRINPQPNPAFPPCLEFDKGRTPTPLDYLVFEDSLPPKEVCGFFLTYIFHPIIFQHRTGL